MKDFLKEAQTTQPIYNDAHAKELLQLRVNYNKELQRLNDRFAKLEMDLASKYMRLSQQQQTISTAQQKETTQQPQQQKMTGTVTTSGQPVNADGSPVTKESYEDILKVKEKLNETEYDTEDVDAESLQDLKDYMDAENISYIEDEDDTTLDFDEDELDDEWFDELDDLGFKKEDEDVETDDILDVEDEEDKENTDKISKDIDEKKVFYVKIKDEGKEFTGKLYKLFDGGDWRAKLVDGESDTFEKMNYDPDFDQYDIIAFLRENYDDADLISEDEFNDHVEHPVEEPEEVEEALGGNGNVLTAQDAKLREHRIETYEEFLNESKLQFSDGEEFDLSGPLRVEERKDGFYVIGEGRMIPVRSRIDGLNTINEIIAKNV